MHVPDMANFWIDHPLQYIPDGLGSPSKTLPKYSNLEAEAPARDPGNPRPYRGYDFTRTHHTTLHGRQCPQGDIMSRLLDLKLSCVATNLDVTLESLEIPANLGECSVPRSNSDNQDYRALKTVPLSDWPDSGCLRS